MVDITRLSDLSKEELINQILFLRNQLDNLRIKELGERIKELNCLYSISKAFHNHSASIGQILQHIVKLIPPGWQYPEITYARIQIDNELYISSEMSFKETPWKIHQDIRLKHKLIGSVEVFYLERKEDLDHGPFLKEELYLLNAIAEIIGRNIQRIQYEQELQQSLEEKEILLQEIHHRVKNNLQVITALINLHKRQITNPSELLLLQELNNRIKSISLIHDILYKKEASLHQVDLSKYINSLGEILFRTYKTDPSRIKLIMNIDAIRISLEIAINCGLIINELLSNSLKHAFPEPNQEGIIWISVKKQKNNTIRLTVADNGIGLQSRKILTDSDTLGIKLINLLINKIKGTLKISLKTGLKFAITFQGQ